MEKPLSFNVIFGYIDASIKSAIKLYLSNNTFLMFAGFVKLSKNL